MARLVGCCWRMHLMRQAARAGLEGAGGSCFCTRLYVLLYGGTHGGAIAGRDKVQRMDFYANRSLEKAACTPPSLPDEAGHGRQGSLVAGEKTARRCSIHIYVAEIKPIEGRRKSPGPS
ncbi:hypothetical protein MRB53_029928 [Persea americana]|uniref:Uncharacterized protein n=1 Tax=Persea americana TaxID=3435 RepID=A0ACC2KJU7_PERAE|nr:hypothetical protein MRB53_029928 [Persea americana]